MKRWIEISKWSGNGSETPERESSREEVKARRHRPIPSEATSAERRSSTENNGATARHTDGRDRRYFLCAVERERRGEEKL